MFNQDHELDLWKRYYIGTIFVLLGISFPFFFVSGYTALYWAWPQHNLERALPYLPWARTFGMLGIVTSGLAFGVLFAPRTFPLSPRIRLWLSLLATVMIGFFAEFRNDGKFHFKQAVHFFGPDTWARNEVNMVIAGLGDSFYRLEYSQWNDFMMGPDIVSVLFALLFWSIRTAVLNPSTSLSLNSSKSGGAELEQALRLARIIMLVGLVWFFAQAWGEKAGYLRNSHSSDEIDLPTEFAGVVLGFWMVRHLTRPFFSRPEQYRSTFLIDFIVSGVVGLAYTLIVGVVTEGIERAVAHALYANVPASFEVSGYTPLLQRLRPFELVLLASVCWWSFNKTIGSQAQEFADDTQASGIDLDWRAILTVVKGLAVAAVCLAFWGAIISFLRLTDRDWPLTITIAAIISGLGAFGLSRQGKLTLLSDHGDREL